MPDLAELDPENSFTADPPTDPPAFEDVIDHWNEQLAQAAQEGRLTSGAILVWQAAKESMEALAAEIDSDDAPDDLPVLTDAQNAAIGILLSAWREWAPQLVNSADPNVPVFIERFGSILREVIRLLLPSAGVEPEEVDGALAAIPFTPSRTAGASAS